MNIETSSFIESLSGSSLDSFINVLQAYRNNCFSYCIQHIIIDNTTGALCMLLENGITLSSIYGDAVIYSTDDLSKDRIYPDIHFEKYSEALKYIG